ncbi:EAL and HDOD domain-containing protein [Nitrosomonas sp.]|uniref:EAL and HDOD domain-containing protein n=1 Tax=Nitrosomonas sp. TaxID=42353 RepID=UPI0020812E5D|nr:HDOD domain-containing protein [Nitrosomonas sp.]GJL73928.1 MAG: cyclic diguanylate phosphodiesterase [Nitrosomonas sp.]
MDDIFLGRQPILDRKQNLVAFELLFRLDGVAEANVTNHICATANVIVNAYGAFGIQEVLGKQRGFVNVDAELLMSDVICMLPSSNVVLEIMESVNITDKVVQRCIELKQMGYQLALDDVIEINEEIELLLSIVNVVKIDILALEKEALVSIVNRLKCWPVLLLAEKVNSSEQAKQCMELGFEMFQGYYFAKPEILSGKRADPAKLSLLNLLTLSMSDCDVADIEQELKHQPGLSYNLMRMVNSTASGVSKNINSIKQAVMILGRRQLQRWIQLLLYAADNKHEKASDAMLKMAATRGKMMELIAALDRPHDKSHQDRAFMVGILSLLDALLGIEMTEITEKLSIPPEISQALLYRNGRLGQGLKLIEANEKGEVVSVKSILDELNFLSLKELTRLELEALGWANRIGDAA